MITNLSVVDSHATIDWNSTSNLYIPAQCPSLTTGTFEYVGAVVATNSATVSNAADISFYRIRQVEVVVMPDPNFEAAVRSAIPHKYAPTNLVYDIDVHPITALNTVSAGITSAVGIAWMDQLTYLDCSENALTHLDLTGNSMLQNLTCLNNNLGELDLSGCVELQQLECSFNALSNLTVSASADLEFVWCHDNQLTDLDVSSNTQLVFLNCSHNSLTSLITAVNANLSGLYCFSNQLTVLDISGNPNMDEVYAHDNPLAEIVVHDTNDLPDTLLYDGTPWIHEP
jgi:hypothetical protein